VERRATSRGNAREQEIIIRETWAKGTEGCVLIVERPTRPGIAQVALIVQHRSRRTGILVETKARIVIIAVAPVIMPEIVQVEHRITEEVLRWVRQLVTSAVRMVMVPTSVPRVMKRGCPVTDGRDQVATQVAEQSHVIIVARVVIWLGIVPAISREAAVWFSANVCTVLWFSAKVCTVLWFSANVCVVLWFSAKICTILWFHNDVWMHRASLKYYSSSVE